MKLRYQFACAPVGDMFMAVAVGRDAAYYHGMVEMNDVGAFLFRKLQRDTNEEALVQALLEEYEVTPETASQDIRELLNLLDEKGILEK